MTDHLDRFHAALTVLAGHGHIKQRLIRAFEDNLVDIHEDELPIAMKQSFADLRHDMHRVTPLNGEGPICASVRKMSLDEASEIAGRIVSLYGEIARRRDDLQTSLPLTEADEMRVPPFLVKSV
ncbi:MAG: hypothetical protein OES59_03540 [Gammaproteobacteria bacterium]|jgi:hypothetical protein|nr:hypothetical protein [Gammaproteobacteria bacterium]MDH3777873.1 hypothetical protein [Gammaproteobacteria bacterium]MDH3810527.1 hypothetical protein [Gammaproteobacteria bacterium]